MTDNKNLAAQFFTATANADRNLFAEICAPDFQGCLLYTSDAADE